MKVYSVYDKVAKTFNAPFLAENHLVAQRSFQRGVKDNPFCSDLELYCVGSFEPDNYKQPFVSSDSEFVCVFQCEVVDNG